MSFAHRALQSLLAIAAALLLVPACTTSTRPVGQPEIHFRDVEDLYEDIAVYKVFHDGRLVGTARTKRLVDGDSNDQNDRTQMFIHDLNGHTVGFITDEKKAFRLRAHGPPELVGVHPDTGVDILAIFGWGEGNVTLERQAAPQD